MASAAVWVESGGPTEETNAESFKGLRRLQKGSTYVGNGQG